MGREVRRVPAGWEHPKDRSGHYKPLYDEDFETAATRWKQEYAAWEAGTHPDKADNPDTEYWQWNGDPPDEESYRPKWADTERTHYQMYETVSEGTPISPAFATPEELARWLADNGANAGAGATATYKQWLRVCQGSSAPSFVFSPDKGLRSGVEALSEDDTPPAP